MLTIRKTGAVSTLAVVEGVRDYLPDIEEAVAQRRGSHSSVRPVGVRSRSLQGVLREGAIAAGLTALMILLFLGNWRLTLIVMLSIPTSILCALVVMYFMGQTLNTMTLGGFALAVGILVDNSTVVIENIERHRSEGASLTDAIVNGSHEILIPTLLSTLAICIVFVPVFLLSGVAKYLFSPLSLAVLLALLASFVLSFSVVPVMFDYLMKRQKHGHEHGCEEESIKRNPAVWAPRRSIVDSMDCATTTATPSPGPSPPHGSQPPSSVC